MVYALVGVALAIAFGFAVAGSGGRSRLTSHRRGSPRSPSLPSTVLRLSGLFGLDSFGGALVSQSLVAYWFTPRFGAPPELLGVIFLVANVLAGLSALIAAPIAAWIGLIRTMVLTHVPSNVLLIAIPLMPSLPLAAIVLFARFSISQMDIPARQSYIVAIVDPDERSAAAGVTGIARTISSAPAPLISTPLIAIPELASLPFFVGGVLKISYDLLLYRLFVGAPPPGGARELRACPTRGNGTSWACVASPVDRHQRGCRRPQRSPP